MQAHAPQPAHHMAPYPPKIDGNTAPYGHTPSGSASGPAYVATNGSTRIQSHPYPTAPYSQQSQHPLPPITLEDPPRPSAEMSQSEPQAQTSSSSRYRRVRPDTEEIKRVGRSHYTELLSFLRSHLAKVEQTGPRSNAREKLTRLSKQQFTELSTDVYDELMRRQNNAKSGSTTPFLAVRDEFHPKRNQARQKLATLPKNRFKDLASDVFFELERRFPELKEEFRPEAMAREREREAREREGLARKEAIGQPQPSTSDHIIPAKSTLVEEDIAVPYSRGQSGAKNSIASPQQGERSLSPVRDSTGSNGMNGIHDNRSTMYSQASSVGTGFFNGYANSVTTASPNLGRSSGFESGTSALAIEKMRSDYEFRIATLQQRIASFEGQGSDSKEQAGRMSEVEERNKLLERQVKELENELVETRERHDESLQGLREDGRRHQDLHDSKHRELQNTLKQLEDLRLDHQNLLSRTSGSESSSALKEKLETLQDEYSQQEELVQELKGEVGSLLEELRQLSARNDEMMAEKDSDLAIIKDLNNQISSYKRKYENAKTELRNLKATSQLYVQPPKADDFIPASDKGVIADVNLTAFQSSIDELLAAARSKTPSNVLLSMKTVVLATTLVTDDVAKYEQAPGNMAELSPEDHEQLQALKSKCSATLNNLMTACRNHASSHGLSPVSLLDAAASHVSATIVDFVKLLKVRKASKVEADQFEANFHQNGTGLKPLHISAQNTTLSRDGNGSGSYSPITATSFGGSLNPISASDDRFSPRIRQSPNMGRYSPVGYRPDITRKDSVGEGSWRARTSVSSSSSAAVVPSVPALPNSAGDGNGQRREGGDNSSSSSSSIQGFNQRSNTLDSIHTHGSSNSGFAERSTLDETGEENWAELRNYIEVQTEAIVHSIQALLSAIREGAQGVQLNENLTQITTIVSSIVAISKGNLPDKSRSDGERILNELTDNCERLSEMQSHPTFDKSTKSAMASASYGVAKGLKALNGLLNDAEL